MSDITKLARRRTLQSGGIHAAATLLAPLPPDIARGHEGHDHASRTILDPKGKRVRIVGPDAVAGDEFVQDRVTIRVDAHGRIVDLTYG